MIHVFECAPGLGMSYAVVYGPITLSAHRFERGILHRRLRLLASSSAYVRDDAECRYAAIYVIGWGC